MVVSLLIDDYSSILQNELIVGFSVNHHQSLPSMVACLMNL